MEARAERVPLLAGELVAQNVDLIVTFGDPAIRAAQRATQAIPIVGMTDDMVGSGLAASLAQIDNVASRKYPRLRRARYPPTRN